MKRILKNYKSMLILFGGVIIGGVVGLVFREDAKILKPFGDIFLNMLLVVVVPLIFLTITSSIYKMKHPKRIGKILITTFLVFLGTSLVAVLVGIVSTYSFRIVSPTDSDLIREELSIDDVDNSEISINFWQRMVDMVTVDDFSKLFNKDNMIALIVVSILVGVAISMSGDKAVLVINLIDSLLEVVIKFIKIIMYYAPIGLGCYFASLVGTFGSSVAVGYFKTFIVYLFIAILYYFVVYAIYAYIGGGIKGVKSFFKNAIPSLITSLVTCSSAASIPVNIECTKKMGVSSDIANATVSLGASFHKDGSVIGSVFKIMFLVYLFNDFNEVTVGSVMFISLVATLLVTAVPIGGGTISEMLIITMLGYSVKLLPVLTIIATIIDPPATVLNVVGDSASAMLISRIVDGNKINVNNN